MRIRSISDCGKGRKRIDAAYEGADDRICSFVLSGKDVRLLCLRQGENLSQEVWVQILSLLRKSCLQKSADLLSVQDYSKTRLREKLLKSYPAEVTDPVLEELESANYLNDGRYAQNYVRSHMYDRSRIRIRQDLIRRGIEEETADSAICFVFEEAFSLGEDPEVQQIHRILKKKGYNPETADYAKRQKVMASIYRRGYSADKIRSVMQGESDS